MKGYYTFPSVHECSPTILSHIQDTYCGGGGVFPIYRDALSVFYSSSRSNYFNSFLTMLCKMIPMQKQTFFFIINEFKKLPQTYCFVEGGTLNKIIFPFLWDIHFFYYFYQNKPSVIVSTVFQSFSIRRLCLIENTVITRLYGKSVAYW